MNLVNTNKPALIAILAATLVFSMTREVAAHCDSLDGPVIIDARAALESGDVDIVLKRVQGGVTLHLTLDFAHMSYGGF